MVATHGMSPPTSLTVEQAQQATRLGAFIEFVSGTLANANAQAKIDRLADDIRKVGVEHAILSSDLGQAGNPLPADGYATYMEALRKKGFTDQELDRMAKQNPARLWGFNRRSQMQTLLVCVLFSDLAAVAVGAAQAPSPNPPVFLYAAVGARARPRMRSASSDGSLTKTIQRDAAVRRAVCLAPSVDEVSVRRLEQRHAGRSSWRHCVSASTRQPARCCRTDSRSRSATARAPDARCERDARAGRVQQSEQPERAQPERGRHAGLGSEAAGAARRRHLRASDPRPSVEQDGRDGHARQRTRAEPPRRSGRAQNLQLQGRHPRQSPVDRAERRIRISAAARRLSSDAAVHVPEPRAAEPAAGVSHGQRRIRRAEGALHEGHARRPGWRASRSR